METRDIKIFSKYKSARNAVCREIRKYIENSSKK